MRADIKKNTLTPSSHKKPALYQLKQQQNMVAISNTKILLALALAFTIHSSHAIENNLRGADAVSSESNTFVSSYSCSNPYLASLPSDSLDKTKERSAADNDLTQDLSDATAARRELPVIKRPKPKCGLGIPPPCVKV